MSKRIIISVISDLVTDQRVQKVSQTLHDKGYQVLLVGARRRRSMPLQPRAYKTKRISLLFQKGFLMYAEWNFRLFWWLLFKKTNWLLANDLDTLLPNYLVSKLRRRTLVYDTHEFFTGMEELQGRPFVKKVWTRLENFLFPRVRYIYTVNETLARQYEQQFAKPLPFFRNLPYIQQPPEDTVPVPLPFDDRHKILLMQGAGIHFNRGAEELLQSLTLLSPEYVLVFAGNGLAVDLLRRQCAELQLQERVHFTGMLTPVQLRTITRRAWLGFSLDKNTSVNYYCSLPNKLFDYLAAGVPVIASHLPEVERIVTDYRVGRVVDVTATAIAEAVLQIDAATHAACRQQAAKAMQELNWEKESVQLLAFYAGIT